MVSLNKMEVYEWPLWFDLISEGLLCINLGRPVYWICVPFSFPGSYHGLHASIFEHNVANALKHPTANVLLKFPRSRDISHFKLDICKGFCRWNHVCQRHSRYKGKINEKLKKISNIKIWRREATNIWGDKHTHDAHMRRQLSSPECSWC